MKYHANYLYSKEVLVDEIPVDEISSFITERCRGDWIHFNPYESEVWITIIRLDNCETAAGSLVAYKSDSNEWSILPLGEAVEKIREVFNNAE